jgi:hypothetical protein
VNFGRRFVKKGIVPEIQREGARGVLVRTVTKRAAERMHMNTNRPTDEEIRARAWEIFLEQGSQPGHDMDHWLQAQYELMRLPIRKVAELPVAQTQRQGLGARSLVGFVHAAVVLGSGALIHLRR